MFDIKKIFDKNLPVQIRLYATKNQEFNYKLILWEKNKRNLVETAIYHMREKVFPQNLKQDLYILVF